MGVAGNMNEADEIRYLKERVGKLEKILTRTLDLLGRYVEYTDYEGYTRCLLCADDFSNLCYELEDSLSPYKVYNDGK